MTTDQPITHLVVTGPSGIGAQRTVLVKGMIERALDDIAELSIPKVAYTGMAHGVDTLFAQAVRRRWPTTHIVGYRPDAHYNRGCDGLCDETVTVTATATKRTGAHLTRNRAMIEGVFDDAAATSRGCAHLLAITPTSNRHRSGSWNTVRNAERVGMDWTHLVIKEAY